MKILIFTYSISRLAGGLLAAVRDLFTNANFNDVELKLFTFKDKYSEEDIISWKGLSVNFFEPYWFLFSRKARKGVLKENADILHMEGLWRYPQFFMSTWKNKKGKPVVCSPHGMLDPYIVSMQGKMKRIMAKLLFQKSLDDVTCYHALCKKELEDIRAYGLTQPIAVIPNGINISTPRKIYEKIDNKKHLLYLGRLHKKKGIDLLILSIAEIKKKEPNLVENWVLDIVGWDDEGCLTLLKRLVKDNHIEENVVFHGSLFGDDKEKMYGLSNAYILPSHGEGLPMTILEAWSWKLPVLMTPKCNIPEGFDAKAAIYIDDNVESIKNGLRELFFMPNCELEQMGTNGYNLVKDRFTWDSSAKKMQTLYRWVLGEVEKPDFVYE